MYPEMCDPNSSTYNECATDILSCVTDPNFDICASFPEICGVKDLPIVDFQAPFGVGAVVAVTERDANLFRYSCQAVIQGTLMDVVDYSENIFLNRGVWVEPGAQFPLTVAMGARAYQDQATPDFYSLAQGTADVELKIPQMNILDVAVEDEDYEDYVPEREAYFDILGANFDYTSFKDDGGEERNAYFDVQFGYRVPVDESAEPTYLGILFSAELPGEAMYEAGSVLVQWVQYRILDAEGKPSNQAEGIACASFLDGTGAATYEVRAYNYEAFAVDEFSSVDALEQYRNLDTPWGTVESESLGEFYGWSDEMVIDEGNVVQRCLAAMPFSMDAVDAEDFGFYEIHSGARWIGVDRDINAAVADWTTGFRPPNTIPIVDIQAQESIKRTEETSYTDADGNDTTGQIE